MKKIFVHTIEIFDLQLLVCVGVSVDDIKKWADKNKSKPIKEILLVKENYDLVKNTIENSTGFVQVFLKRKVHYYILWLDKYKNNWNSLNILNHEIVHLRQFIFKDRSIDNELEFEAYFHEYIFDSLRIKLNKFIK